MNSNGWLWHLVLRTVWLYLRLQFPCPRHEGIGVIAPLILITSTRWRCVVRFAPRLLYPCWKNLGTPCPGGWVGLRASRREKCLAPTEFEYQTLQPVAESLYRLQYGESCDLSNYNFCYKIPTTFITMCVTCTVTIYAFRRLYWLHH
jgi:hypothetical protein